MLTPKENNAEKAIHGTQLTRDTGHCRAKVTSADIREIVRLYGAGMRRKDIARRFGLRPEYTSRLFANARLELEQ